MSYAAFARFYDAVQGDGADRAGVVRELIERHRPGARTVLEVACGTGSILAHLRSAYDVSGLDRSPEMVARAAEKLPGVPLVEGDMTRFDLGARFDINTEERLARLAEHPPLARWFDGGHLLVLDVRGEGGGAVTWSLAVFEHEGGNRYRLHAEDIPEISFPRERIEESLLERFGSVAVEGAERLYFVAGARTLLS